MNKIDIKYILHCVKNASELIGQDESEKAKGLLLSAELLLSQKLTSDNSDYAKSCECGNRAVIMICEKCNKSTEIMDYPDFA
jgi:hypothetical protein